MTVKTSKGTYRLLNYGSESVDISLNTRDYLGNASLSKKSIRKHGPNRTESN